MIKKYMPQRVFNFGAASIVKAHLLTGREIEEIATKIFASYRNSYIDDGTEKDWILAAHEALIFIENNEVPAPTELLNHFQYFVDNYESDGRPRKKRIFGGTIFNKAKQNLQRKEDFIKLLESYYVGARAGIVPIAPAGWPGNR
jgi:hypothetical protein